MLAMETQHNQQSLLHRSSSIWRRISKRSSRPKHPSLPDEPRKLQKRATEPIHLHANKTIITHLQRVVEPPKKRTAPPPRPIRPATRALASSMQTTRFPKSPHVRTVAWDVFLTPEQVYSLVMGFLPQQMEDKWFIYSEGPDTSGKLKVHFHRSWTGTKIAELFVVIDLKGEGAGKIVGIKWNGTEQTNCMDSEEAKYMIEMTCLWVLGINVEKGFL